MTLEDFKASYKGKTPLEMLKLLIVQTDYIRDDVRSLERDRINGNEKGADYMRSEIRAKEDRIQWLYDQLAPVLKAHEAVKPTQYQEGRWFKTWRCGACGGTLVFRNGEDKPKYCIDCGRAVKW